MISFKMPMIRRGSLAWIGGGPKRNICMSFFAMLVLGLALLDYSERGDFTRLIFSTLVAASFVAIPLKSPPPLTVQILLVSGICLLGTATLEGGGAYTPRLMWLLLMLLPPMYVLRSGWALRWMLAVLIFHWLLVQFPDVQIAILQTNKSLTIDDIEVSWITFCLTSIMMLVVPFVYHRKHQSVLEQELNDQKELETKRDELMHIHALRDQFVASVSHELRTPMNAILGLNELLLMRITDRPEAIKVLQHTRKSADHLMTVISDVLDYSQLQSGNLVLQSNTFNLRETVQNAFEMLAPKAHAQKIDYRCELDSAIPAFVSTDKHRLAQVLVNLLGNALKFTNRGYVVLTVVQQSAGVRFEVKDSGIGIARQHQGEIFGQFAQADSGIAQRYGGNGLGLNISRRLVGLLGGEMDFESQEGVGSRFWFTLPLLAAEPVAPPAVAKSKVQTAHNPWQFLVVDDHPVNRLLVNKVLSASWPNAYIREASDGLEALEALRQKPADVVFMDMLMPNMDGIVCTQHIRQRQRVENERMVIFGLTANVHPQDLQRFREAGLDGLMLKPFNWSDLCSQVEQLLLAR